MIGSTLVILLLLFDLLHLHLSEVLHEALQVELVLGGGLDPEAPPDEVEEGQLELVQLLQGDTPDVRHEVVPVEHIVVEFGCD